MGTPSQDKGVRPPAMPVSPGTRRISALPIVMRDIGALLVLLGATMLVPMIVSLLYGESYSALSLLASACVTAGSGALTSRACAAAGEPERRHAMIIAGLGWFASALFGALPFLFAAFWTPPEIAASFVPAGEVYPSSLVFFRNPLHALFESMSAYTTTGLSMAVHEPSIGYGLLFYRSMAQWVGGAGVIVLSLAIIPRPQVVGALELYQSESAGMKLRPSILGTARAIWKIYTVLTLAVVFYLFEATIILLPDYGAGAALFDAFNHAMTAQSTGGFSTLDDSIAGYRSYAMEMVHIPPMVLGAISIPLYYSFLRMRDLRVFLRDPQFRSMWLLFVVLTPVLVLLLWGTHAVADPVREGVFQIVSGVSTTGWQTSSIGDWDPAAVMLMTWGTMVVGGAAGATVGGVKLIRAYLMYRGAAWRIRKTFLPSDAVVPVRVGERILASGTMYREVSDAAIFTFLYLVTLGVSVVVVARLVGPEFSLADVMFECASAQGTVGLSTGITDPGMPVTVEIVFILQMWIGRLEIFPVIVLLCAPFARRGRG